jgi:hypothetical protein
VHPGATEVCNDRDDDCNGQTDEGDPGGGAACSTGELGVCAAGTRTCQAGSLACVRNTAPSAEVCTGGLDEDCDGQADQADADCLADCVDGDGDGYVSCAACHLPAGKTCGDCDDGSAEVHPGATEVCNDRDDNCNGQNNEGNPGGGAGCLTGQLGLCSAGTLACVGAGLVCQPNTSPLPEVCVGGLDEDCDGFVDAEDADCTPLCPDADLDFFAVCDGSCRLPLGRECGDCDDTRIGVHPGALETCNNRDDDCNGETDEGDPGGGLVCSTGQQGACDAGTRHCVGGQLLCQRNTDPSPEICTNGWTTTATARRTPPTPTASPSVPTAMGPLRRVRRRLSPGGGDQCGDCDDTRASVHPGRPRPATTGRRLRRRHG